MTVVSAWARTTLGQAANRFSMVNVTAGLDILNRVSVLTRRVLVYILYRIHST